MAHKEELELLTDLQRLKERVSVGDEYFHYKHPDQHYKIIAVGFIEATEEPSITYQAEYGEQITWTRTENEFFAKVEHNGQEVDRFTKVN